MQNKWKVLSGELKRAGCYCPDRLSERDLSSRYYGKRASLRESCERVGDRTIHAYAALWATQQWHWYELGTVWVSPSHRGNGFREKVMQEAVSRTPLGSRLFLITSSSPIRRSAEKLGFEIVNTGMYSGLSEWAHDIGLGDRLPDSAKGSGEPTFVEDVRSLFIRP